MPRNESWCPIVLHFENAAVVAAAVPPAVVVMGDAVAVAAIGVEGTGMLIGSIAAVASVISSVPEEVDNDNPVCALCCREWAG